MTTQNKIWSPSFNLKHSSSDYITKKRNQTLYANAMSFTPALYSYENNSNVEARFPSYWMRKSINDGARVCFPCEEDIYTLSSDIINKQYE